MRDVLIKAEWFKFLDKAPEEVKRELGYRIIKYGVFGEELPAEEQNGDFWVLANVWANIQGNLDRMDVAKQKSEEYGKTHGKQVMGDPVLVWKYWQENPKSTVDDIGKALDLEPKLGAKKGPYSYLYENAGWKNRKDKDWLKNYSKINDDDFPENFPDRNSNLENSGKNLEGNLENVFNF